MWGIFKSKETKEKEELKKKLTEFFYGDVGMETLFNAIKNELDRSEHDTALMAHRGYIAYVTAMNNDDLPTTDYVRELIDLALTNHGLALNVNELHSLWMICQEFHWYAVVIKPDVSFSYFSDNYMAYLAEYMQNN